MRLGDGKLHALVLADGAAKDLARAGIIGNLVDEPMPVANAFRRDQRAFRIEPVKNVFEPLNSC